MMELGKYRLYEELGRGGYGTVYRAYDTTLKVERAVKILHPALMADMGFIERFKREAQVAAHLEHPHIVPVYEIGEEGGYYYLVMKYMSGGSLKDRLEKGGRLSYETALELTCQVGRALEKAHGEGLVHRDVKPGNILLEENAAVRLTDFGFARAMQSASNSEMSRTGGIAGTPAYMAPELWDGKEAAPATDLYSLACVFYEMIIGTPIFSGDTPSELMKKHIMASPQYPDQWPQGVPPGMEDVLKRALEKEPRERYPGVGRFLEDLLDLKEDHGTCQETTPVDLKKEEKTVWKKCEDCGKIYDSSLKKCPSCVLANMEVTDTSQTVKGPTLGIGSTRVWQIDGMEMVYVPEGEFLMGSQYDDMALDNEKPQHHVYLDAYWIDEHEVTNEMFEKFVKETDYITDAEKKGPVLFALNGQENKKIEKTDKWKHPYGESSNINGLEKNPVVYVSWNDAIAYCQWAGKRLPTEAEWEKAARGTDARRFPWGDDLPSRELANYIGVIGATTSVYNYPAGASQCRALDMAGNVWEWVSDWIGSYYYKDSPFYYPQGALSGKYKVLRGGSFESNEFLLRSAYRNWGIPDSSSRNIGFRCVSSVK